MTEVTLERHKKKKLGVKLLRHNSYTSQDTYLGKCPGKFSESVWHAKTWLVCPTICSQPLSARSALDTIIPSLEGGREKNRQQQKKNPPPPATPSLHFSSSDTNPSSVIWWKTRNAGQEKKRGRKKIQNNTHCNCVCVCVCGLPYCIERYMTDRIDWWKRCSVSPASFYGNILLGIYVWDSLFWLG